MKKIFTLISTFVLALSANADNVISFANLACEDFNYDTKYYEATTKTIEEVDYPAFTYKGGGTYSAIELGDGGIQFNYKNSGAKTAFFTLGSEYITVGGKGAQVIVPNAVKGQKITFRVAAKGDDAAPTFAIKNAIWQSGDPSTLTTANEFIDIVYQSSVDGEVTLSESAKGFNIASVTLGDGGGEIIVADGKYYLSFDGQTAANILEYGEGFKLQITGNLDKTIGGGENVTVGEKLRKSMKVSNGAQNTLTLPKGKVTSGIKLYSYINSETVSEKDSYWKEIAGVTFESTELAGGVFESYKDLENLDVIEYTFNGKTNSITFTNTGVQCCYVIEVDIVTGDATEVTEVTANRITGIESVKAANVAAQNGAIYNMAGQKVSADYKGVVIKDGKKVMQ